MKFIEDEGFPEIYDKSLTRRGLNNRFSCRQRIAIKKEIEELLSQQCKRKTVLRDNLKNRYKYAFPKDQEKVLRCMLFQPSVKERQWAYSKLSASWSIWYALDPLKRLTACFRWNPHTETMSEQVKLLEKIGFVNPKKDDYAPFKQIEYVISR